MFSQLLSIRDFFSMLANPTFWFILVAGIGLILVILASIKNFRVGKYVLITIFTIGVVALTTFSGIQLNYYYNTSGGIYGAITGIFKTNEVTIVDNIAYEFTNTELVQVGDTDTYSASIIINEVMELENNIEYDVFVNDVPCDYVQNSTDYVLANYIYCFYDEEFNVLCEDTLTFRFAFYTNSTHLKVSTNGGADAVKFWNYYFNKNKFIVSLKAKQYNDNATSNYVEGDISNFAKVTFISDLYTDGRTEHVRKSTEKCTLSSGGGYAIYVTKIETDGEYEIKSLSNHTMIEVYWYNATYVNIYIDATESNEIEEGIFYSLNYYVKDELYHAENVLENNYSKLTTTPQVEGYDFLGWSADGVNIVDLSTYKITQDTTFTALFGSYKTMKLYKSLIMDGEIYNENIIDRYKKDDDSIIDIDLTKSNMTIRLCSSLGVYSGNYADVLTITGDKLGKQQSISASSMSFSDFKMSGTCYVTINKHGTLDINKGNFVLGYKSGNYGVSSDSYRLFINQAVLYVITK